MCMRIPRTIVRWCLPLSAAAAFAAGAQTPSGALDASGRVLLRAYAVIHDGTGYQHQQLGAALRIVGPSGVAIPVTTDASGEATAWLAPGQYRVATTSPVTWDGHSYTWDQAVDVAPGMGILELNERNASAVAAIADVAEPAQLQQQRLQPRDLQDQKDPALATVLSFFVPGIGEFYAGAPGTGAIHLAMDLAATGVAVYGLTCNANFTCSDGAALAVGGATMALVNTAFSMYDAHHAATNYNRERGLMGRLESARPMVAMGQRGETRVGLSFATR